MLKRSNSSNSSNIVTDGCLFLLKKHFVQLDIISICLFLLYLFISTWWKESVQAHFFDLMDLKEGRGGFFWGVE